MNLKLECIMNKNLFVKLAAVLIVILLANEFFRRLGLPEDPNQP